jgi:two-component system LytT family response regulator
VSGGADLGTIRAVICEDEPLARRAIQEYLRDVEWVEIVGTAGDGKEALRMIHKLEPDLVFLDVRMPGMGGVEVLEALEYHPAVVFTTAFDEYAISAFELGAIDYLVKPFGRDRLIQTLDRVRVRLVGEGRSKEIEPAEAVEPGFYAERIFARHRGAMVPVPVGDIRRVDAVDGGVSVVTDGRVFELDATLSEVAGRLDPRDFVRVHRAHLVNLAHVVGIRRYDERRLVISLDDDSTIVASRRGSRSLRDLMD